MRYIKETNGILEEYNGLSMGETWMINNGFLVTELLNPICELKIEDGIIKLKTEEELLEIKNKIEEEEFKNYYLLNPDLKKRVLEFKSMIDTLGLSYDITSITPESISTAVNNSENIPTELKTVYISNALAIWQFGIVFNLKCLEINNAEVFAFYNFDKLIKHLN